AREDHDRAPRAQWPPDQLLSEEEGGLHVVVLINGEALPSELGHRSANRGCPALSTTKFGVIPSNARATTTESVTSPWTVSIAPFTSCFTFSSLSALRDITRTLAPFATKASTVARPIPLAPPVTTG